jgi:DNA gyrase/topoisomerase IV subunit A
MPSEKRWDEFRPMTTLPFDTHKAVKDLQEAGFEEAQAEAVVATVGAAIVGNVATRHDVIEARNDLRAEMQTLDSERKTDIQKLGSDLRAEMQTLDSERRADIQKLGSDLRDEMQAMELRITLRMGGLIIAGVGLIVALDKLV